MPAVRCPRCDAVTAFAAADDKVCPECNFPGPEVRMRAAIGGAWAEEGEVAATAPPAPAVAAPAHAASVETPALTTSRAVAEVLAAIEPPEGSWDEAARKPPTPPRPPEPVARNPDFDIRFVERLRPRYRVPEDEEIIDCVDQDLLAKDRIGGRGMLLTDRRVHHVARSPLRRDRVVVALADVQAAGHRHHVDGGTLVVGGVVGGVLGVAAFLAGAMAAWTLVQAVLLAAALPVFAFGAAFFLARRKELWFATASGTHRMQMRSVPDVRLEAFVDRVLAQRDRVLGHVAHKYRRG